METALAALKEAAATDANLMAHLIGAAPVHAGEGEIVHAPQQVWGDDTETPVL